MSELGFWTDFGGAPHGSIPHSGFEELHYQSQETPVMVAGLT